MLWARIVAWSAAVLPWLRWGARASTVEGPPAEQVGEAGSSPELLADGNGRKTGTAAMFSDKVGPPVAGVVLRRGGKEEGAQAQVYPEKKVAKGVLGAPLTVEWVVTVEAVEVPVIGRLLVVSSCTDGEKVMRGGSRLRRKMWRRGNAGKAVARWPYQWRSRA
jgi:hypothetical protein